MWGILVVCLLGLGLAGCAPYCTLKDPKLFSEACSEVDRRESLRDLAKMSPDRAMAHANVLLAGLHNEKEEIRSGAVEGLGIIGAPAAVLAAPELKKLLGTAPGSLRASVIVALGRMGATVADAIPQLEDMLLQAKMGCAAWTELISTLRSIGTPAAIEAIKKCDEFMSAQERERNAEIEAREKRCKTDADKLGAQAAEMQRIECSPKYQALSEDDYLSSDVLFLQRMIVACLYTYKYSSENGGCTVGVPDDSYKDLVGLAVAIVDYWQRYGMVPKPYLDSLTRFVGSLYADDSVAARPSGWMGSGNWTKASTRGAGALAWAAVLIKQEKWAEAKRAIEVAKQSFFYSGQFLEDYLLREHLLWLQVAIEAKNFDYARRALTTDDYQNIIINPKKYSGRKIVIPTATVLRVYPAGQIDRSNNVYVLCSVGESKSDRIQSVVNTAFTWDSYWARLAQEVGKEDELFLLEVVPADLEQAESLRGGQAVSLVGAVTGRFGENRLNQAIPKVRLGYLIRG